MQKIIYLDDIHGQRGEGVPSTRTETLSFAGESVELDLTDPTVKEAMEMTLRELFDMGRPTRKATRVPGRTRTAAPQSGMTRAEANAYNRGLREWAASIGEPIQRYESDGTYRYTVDMKQRYAEYLESNGG
jgi:hypothetical protein